jgi:aryl-alcohol dehydrogenase-like predicted oxidoreductase
MAALLDILRAEAARLATSVDAMALAAALARPWTDLVLSGATTTHQLRSNLRALDCPWDDASETRLSGSAFDPHEYWARRASRPWT